MIASRKHSLTALTSWVLHLNLQNVAKKKNVLSFWNDFCPVFIAYSCRVEPKVLVFTSWGFHFFMVSVRMVNSVEWSPAAKKGTEKRRSRRCDKKKICKLCKVMQLETTRLHLLAPLNTVVLQLGAVWRVRLQVWVCFFLNVQRLKWQQPDCLCWCHLVKWAKTKRRAPWK